MFRLKALQPITNAEPLAVVAVVAAVSGERTATTATAAGVAANDPAPTTARTATAAGGTEQSASERFTKVQRKARRAVLARLEAEPSIERAFVNRWEGDWMIVTLAVRGVGTCELSIPRARFDGDELTAYGALVQCIDRAGGSA